MTDCCGRCAHHYEGQERQITTVLVDKKTKGRHDYIVTTTEFGGHTSHPNGKCTAAGGRFRGVLTGFYGHCDKFLQRGARPPSAPEQEQIDPFAVA